MKFNKADLQNHHLQALTARMEFESEWRKLSDYLLPGRGVYQLYPNPQKRELTSKKVINNTGNDALQVFTSGFHSGLTSSSRPWVKLDWKDKSLKRVRPLKHWINTAEKRFHELLLLSNFYQLIPSLYSELAGFGTSSLYMGESWTTRAPFHFELLTVGEYCFSIGNDGNVNRFFRTIFITYKNLVNRFPDKVNDLTKRAAESRPDEFTTIVNAVVDEPTMGKPYTSFYYEPGSDDEFLHKGGFNEFPYFVSQWDVIGSDTYGLGLGSRALPEIMRLQELEKSYLMGVHKVVDPPLNAPARKKGHITTLPGGVNWYSNPNEKVEEMLKVQLDLNAVGMAIDRLEGRIRRMFFNDMFITASRDPNASPLKAAEVYERKDEKLIRIGPSTERFISSTLQPLVERGIKIMERHDELPPIPEEYRDAIDNIDVTFVSPLAQAQKLVASQSISSYLGFASGIAQFDPTAKDKISTDRLMDEGADIYGVPQNVMATDDEVKAVRDQRARQLAEQKQKEDALLQAELAEKQAKSQSEAAKNTSEAGVNLMDTLGMANEQAAVGY